MIVEKAITWLEIILFERFGVHFDLLLVNGGVELHHKGSKGFIFFDNILPQFLNVKEFPCSDWNCAVEGWDSVLGMNIPAPGGVDLPTPLIELSQENYIVHYDILGLTFWMLSRQEELITKKTDSHGRFPANASHAYQYNYLDRPIVDEWLHVLRQVIQRQWSHIILRVHHFSTCLSHDVDAPSRYAFMGKKRFIRTLVGAISRLDFKVLLLAIQVKMNTKTELLVIDPFNTFDYIMDLSEKYNLQSAFYFICGRTSVKNDADYELEHPVIRNLMKNIYERGHEIGLHPSYNTYKAKLAIMAELTRLKKVCNEEKIEQELWGGRMHCLRWDNPLTLRGWENAEMAYDSTLGYADRSGFRCGTCFEYPAFDLENKKILNLRIRPLIAMECTIIADRYMGLGYSKEALETFLALKDACRKVNGTFTLLWHNSHFLNKEDRLLYSKIIAY